MRHLVQVLPVPTLSPSPLGNHHGPPVPPSGNLAQEQIATTTIVAVVCFSDSPTRLKSLGIDAMLNPCLQCEFVD